MFCNNVQILNFNHNIVEVGSDNKLIITDNVKCNSITIPQPVTNILQINSPGPQGPAGTGGGGSIDTGSFVTTSSFNAYTGSNTSQFAGTASFATTASYALFAANGGGPTIDTSSFVTTSSFNAFTQSINTATSSFVTNSQTSSFVTNSQTSSFVTTSSFNTFTSSYNTGSFSGSFIGSLQGTASWANSASIAISSSFATTASYAMNAGTTVDTGSFVTTSSFNAFTQSINTATSSFVLNSQTSSMLVPYVLTSVTSSMLAPYVQNNQTSSFVQNSQTSSFVTTSSFNSFTSSYNTGSFSGSFTGNLIGTATTASYISGSVFTSTNPALSASYALTSSFATTASYIDPTFISASAAASGFGSGETTIDTGSFATTGSNNFNGNQIITGSLSQGLAGNIATGEYSHAEGSITKAIGEYSHAEGDFTEASGNYSHAEGQNTMTLVSAQYSHAEGNNTIAAANHQHVQGQWNVTSSIPAAFIVGNGTDNNNRSNLIYAHDSTVEITGSLEVNGGITGSLFGTATTASYVSGSVFTSTNPALSASFATTASFALTTSNAQNAQDILIYVKNTSGAQINKGKVVRISGATGDNALIATASYESDRASANTLGITTQNIANDSFGYVITEGTLIGINTDAFTAGQLLYLGATGSIIGTAPIAPLHAVRLGQVLRVQQNNGSIYVRIDNGYEIGELHDVVDTTTTSSYGDLLIKSGSVWTNSKQLTGSYELTGSLVVTQNISASSFTGSLQGTASFASTASIASSVVGATPTEIGYLSGVTSAVQTQLDSKVTNNAWVDYSATSTIVGFTAYAIKRLQYKITAPDTMIVMFEITSTASSGSGTATSFTLPFSVTSWGTQYNTYRFQNNISTALGVCTAAASSNTVNLYPGGALTNWTNATTRAIQGVIILNI
jgi:hypothetical protein